MGKMLYWLEKAAYLALGAGVTLYVLSFLKVWSFEQNRYFSFVGDIESLIVITVIVTGATLVLHGLWKWEVREVFKTKKTRRKK